MTDTSATGRSGDATGGVGAASAGAGNARSAEERWHLEDRRDFLLRSLDDADREHQAGDLSDDDYHVLCRRDRQQLAEVDQALAALGVATAGDGAAVGGAAGDGPAGADATAGDRGPAGDRGAAGDRGPAGDGGPTAAGPGSPARPATASPVPGRPGLVPLVLDDDEEDGRPRPRRRRIWMAVVGVAALVAGAVLLVVHVTAPRLPGEVATGSTKVPAAQTIQRQLAVAATLVDQTKLVTALDAYKAILSETPRQPQALAEWGWLNWQAAEAAGNLTLAAQGRSAVAQSVNLAPSQFAGHLYLGSILLAQHQPAKAVAEYRAFLADHPPKEWVAKAAGYITQAFTEVHQPVPAQVRAAAGAGTPGSTTPGNTTSGSTTTTG
ncbi:MAG TPA: collagen-like protein [Acidimicrobiales bacterium]|nr:collagen-like protein [Acidimicrobiales bacterium]